MKLTRIRTILKALHQAEALLKTDPWLEGSTTMEQIREEIRLMEIKLRTVELETYNATRHPN